MLSTLGLDKNRGAQLEASVRMKYGDIYRNTEYIYRNEKYIYRNTNDELDLGHF